MTGQQYSNPRQAGPSLRLSEVLTWGVYAHFRNTLMSMTSAAVLTPITIDDLPSRTLWVHLHVNERSESA